MKQPPQQHALGTAKMAVGVTVLALATGAAFAFWLDKGAAILMATIESGLAWCF